MRPIRVRAGLVLAIGVSLGLLAAAPGLADVEADGIFVKNGAGQTIAHLWQTTVTGSFDVPFNAQTEEYEAFFLDPDSLVFQPGPSWPPFPAEGTTWLRSLFSNPGRVAYDSTGYWKFKLRGLVAGSSTTVFLRLFFVDHYDYTSQPIPVTVDDPTGVDIGVDAVDARALFASPNPARGHTSLYYRVADAGHVVIEMFDAAGRSVASFDEGVRAAGTHRFEWSAPGRAPGVYFAKVRTPSGVRSARVHLLR